MMHDSSLVLNLFPSREEVEAYDFHDLFHFILKQCEKQLLDQDIATKMRIIATSYALPKILTPSLSLIVGLSLRLWRLFISSLTMSP